MTYEDARSIVKVLLLLNDKERFGFRDRRMRFDSYDAAAELEAVLARHGFKPTDADIQPREVGRP
jgi:hypothetical protein